MPQCTNGWLNVGIVEVYFISNQNAWKWCLAKIVKCSRVVLSKNSKRPHTHAHTHNHNVFLLFFFLIQEWKRWAIEMWINEEAKQRQKPIDNIRKNKKKRSACDRKYTHLSWSINQLYDRSPDQSEVGLGQFNLRPTFHSN